jgi:voltage-gated sodium channel
MSHAGPGAAFEGFGARQNEQNSTRPGMNARLRAIIGSRGFQWSLTLLIAINAITLGMQTSAALMSTMGPLLIAVDNAILWIFVAEIAAKLAVYRSGFFRDPWNLFDFTVVGIALLPATGPLSVLRSLRVLRVLRLASTVPAMRRVIEGLLASIPGISSVVALLFLMFYVFAVMGTKLYAETAPEAFGTLGRSMFTLFQVMTLGGWSTDVVRPMMEANPYVWAFFLPFILVTSFAVLNLFIAIIVNAMGEQHDTEQQAEIAEITGSTHADNAILLSEVRALREEVRALRAKMP